MIFYKYQLCGSNKKTVILLVHINVSRWHWSEIQNTYKGIYSINKSYDLLYRAIPTSSWTTIGHCVAFPSGKAKGHYNSNKMAYKSVQLLMRPDIETKHLNCHCGTAVQSKQYL